MSTRASDGSLRPVLFSRQADGEDRDALVHARLIDHPTRCEPGSRLGDQARIAELLDEGCDRHLTVRANARAEGGADPRSGIERHRQGDEGPKLRWHARVHDGSSEVVASVMASAWSSGSSPGSEPAAPTITA